MKTLCKSSAVALIAAVALGLGACSADSGKDAKPNANEKVTIQYLHRLPDGEGMTKVAEIIKKWNAEHPNIQVEATKFDGKAQELIKKLETDVKAKNAPCLAQIGYGEVAETYVKGLLEDVTKEAKKYTKNFSAGPVGLMTVDNKIVGLPQDTGPLMYMYNKAEFKKLGLKVPQHKNLLKLQQRQLLLESTLLISSLTKLQTFFRQWLALLAISSMA